MEKERHKRTRATCVVEIPTPTGGSLLLTREAGSKDLILPGGWIRKGESVTDAAKRELQAETGAEAMTAVHLFDYESARTRHKVVLIVPKEGALEAGKHVEELRQLSKAGGNLKKHELWSSLNRSMQAILERYLAAQ